MVSKKMEIVHYTMSENCYIHKKFSKLQGLFKNCIQFGKTSIKYMEIQTCAPSLIEESSVVWDWEIQGVPHTLFIK